MRGRAPLTAPVEWTPENQQELALFLGTETGRKMRQALVAQIAAENERAAMEGTALACGRAQGYRALWAMWESFSTFAEQPANGLQPLATPADFTPPPELAHLAA